MRDEDLVVVERAIMAEKALAVVREAAVDANVVAGDW